MGWSLPVTEFLSPQEQASYAGLREEVLDIALREGSRSALRRQLHGMGVDRNDREDDADPPASTREQSRQTGFLLTREARTIESYRVNREALRAQAGKLIPAFGVSSRSYYPAQCAIGLAAALNQTPAEFPGGHTGYVLRPRAFAEVLSDTLRVSPPAPDTWGPVLFGNERVVEKFAR